MTDARKLTAGDPKDAAKRLLDGWPGPSSMLDEHPNSSAYKSAWTSLSFWLGRVTGQADLSDEDAAHLFKAVLEEHGRRARQT